MQNVNLDMQEKTATQKWYEKILVLMSETPTCAPHQEIDGLRLWRVREMEADGYIIEVPRPADIPANRGMPTVYFEMTDRGKALYDRMQSGALWNPAAWHNDIMACVLYMHTSEPRDNVSFVLWWLNQPGNELPAAARELLKNMKNTYAYLAAVVDGDWGFIHATTDFQKIDEQPLSGRMSPAGLAALARLTALFEQHELSSTSHTDPSAKFSVVEAALLYAAATMSRLESDT